MRTIVFILLVILVFLVIRFTLNRIIEIRAQNRKNEQIKTENAASQAIVPCAYCGVHIPKEEAIQEISPTNSATDSSSNNSADNEPLYFCCKEHQKAFHQEPHKEAR